MVSTGEELTSLHIEIPSARPHSLLRQVRPGTFRAKTARPTLYTNYTNANPYSSPLVILWPTAER